MQFFKKTIELICNGCDTVGRVDFHQMVLAILFIISRSKDIII